jgi:hypothetical protein
MHKKYITDSPLPKQQQQKSYSLSINHHAEDQQKKADNQVSFKGLLLEDA